jgi:hypothetical protein
LSKINTNLKNYNDLAYLGKYLRHLKEILVAIEIAEIDFID